MLYGRLSLKKLNLNSLILLDVVINIYYYVVRCCTTHNDIATSIPLTTTVAMTAAKETIAIAPETVSAGKSLYSLQYCIVH